MLSLKHTFKRKIFTKRFVNEYIQRNYAIKSESETIEVASNATKEFRSFQQMMIERRLEALRTIVVQVASRNSFSELHRHCQQFGEINNSFYYESRLYRNHYILLEYKDVESANEALRSGIYNVNSSNNLAMLAKSRFLWLRAVNNKKQTTQSEDSAAKLRHDDNIYEVPKDLLVATLTQANSLSEQITLLHEHIHLNDLSIRLRFFGALQIESALSGVFSDLIAYPFGSSVNGFGKIGSDLDVVLSHSKANKTAESNGRLVFYAPLTETTSEREILKQQIKGIGEMIKYLLPGSAEVLTIAKARVPIVKYYQKLLNLNIDVSTTNLSGYYMSELLHIFGEIDPRVRPLVSCIRLWSRAMKLTSDQPGQGFTNFPITCLVIFFLQQLERPILPTLGHLIELAEDSDKCIVDKDIDCTYLRDLSKMQFQTTNTSSLEELFRQFLEFYSERDFSQVAISLRTRKILKKVDRSPLYIVNPLEVELNVAKNLSFQTWEQFQLSARVSVTDSKLFNGKQDDQLWGLMRYL